MSTGPLNPGPLKPGPLNGWDILEQARELAEQGEDFALATVVWRQGPSSGQQGSRAIITAAGQLHGWIGGACAEPAVIRQAQQVMRDGEPKLLLLGSVEQFGAAVPEGMVVVPVSCASEGALEVYVEPATPRPRLLVVGRSPMASTLTELATALGWRADLLDHPDFSAADVDRRTIVVVATQGHGDEEAVEQAVGASPAYVGLVASRRRGEAVLGYLADRGVPQHQLDRVRVPVGLDLGHTTHREIAVAILAELVRDRAAGNLVGGTSGSPENTAAQVFEPAQAIDPVCGMTVRADASSHPVEHQGIVSYFCCVGCRDRFLLDPDAYLTATHRSEEA
ncbi:XdhC family protein [Angustibacter sp. McL0619]|uniref:XdhC family protein n=1 Tax=Angustibacter sp. McL0619 TaxID=3415676 RepID=UPI003CEF20AE